jgi:hypothetical protein
MAPNLVLHVGLDKTGTTAIQRFMADNETLFREKEILYPLTGRYPTYPHHGLFAHISKRPSTGRYVEAATTWQGLLSTLDAEIEQKHPSTVVMSSEILGQGVDMAALKDLRRRFDHVTVILYLRPQDDYLASVYTQMVKSSGEYRHFAIENLHDANFLDLCETWAKFAENGALYVRRYGESYLQGGNLLSDFLRWAFGIELTDDMIVDQRNHNPRLTNDALEFKRLINLCTPLTISSHFISPLLSTSYEQDLSTADDFSRNSLLLPAARKRIMVKYRESNTAVARSYLGLDIDTLFEPAAKSGAISGYEGLTNVRAAFIASQLIDHFSDQTMTRPALSAQVERAILRALELCVDMLTDIESENRMSDDDGVRLQFSHPFVVRGLAIKAEVGQLLSERSPTKP